MSPSGVRYRVVAFTVALAGVTYLDRAAIGVLADPISRDLSLTPVKMGWAFSAFTLAYAIFEMPTAWWADRIGSRRVLTRIVVWWSAFTMLTGAAFNYVSLLATRFLFGAGEAGAFPNAGRIFSRWIPERERGRIQGVFFAGAHLAGGLTPAVILWLSGYLPWRAIFVLFGFVGLAWSIAFFRWFRDEPRDHPSVNAAERDYIEATRGMPPARPGNAWKEVFATPGIVPLCVQYFANTYGTYFCLTWLPTYLTDVRGMASTELAIFAGLPLTLAAAADITGGITTDALTRRVGPGRSYRTVGSLGYVIAAAALLTGTLSADGRRAGLLISLAYAATMFTLAPAWNTALALGGQNAGLMAALMNTAGQVGGFLSPLVLAYLLDWFGDWTLPLHVLTGLYLVAAVSWLFIRPEKRA